LYENKKLDPLRKFNKWDIEEMWSQNKFCKKCGKLMTADMKTGDHIIAWSQGGRTKTSNLQILCKSCNSSKGADEDGEE
jgi:5-methylcytosine-specific restriction endonuclease McrA